MFAPRISPQAVPPIFGILPDPTTTNQPAPQTVASVRGGSGVNTNPPPVLITGVGNSGNGTAGVCTSYVSPYVPCVSSTSNGTFPPACTAPYGWQVTVVGIGAPCPAPAPVPTHRADLWPLLSLPRPHPTVTALWSDYFIMQNSTGSDGMAAYSGIMVYTDGVTSYNGPVTVGQQVQVSGSIAYQQGNTMIQDGATDGPQNTAGNYLPPWGYNDAGNTFTGKFPMQMATLNGGAVLSLPTGVPAKTGWFTPYMGPGVNKAGSPGLAVVCGNYSGNTNVAPPGGSTESLRNVRVTFSNVIIRTLENSNGYMYLDDGTGWMLLNSQIVGLNQVSGICGFKVGDTIASITLTSNWFTAGVNGTGGSSSNMWMGDGLFGGYQMLLTSTSDVSTTGNSIATPTACYPRAFNANPPLQTIPSLSGAVAAGNPLTPTNGSAASWNSPYIGTPVRVQGVVIGMYKGVQDWSGEVMVGWAYAIIQDNTVAPGTLYAGVKYELNDDAWTCPIGTSASPLFCAGTLRVGQLITLTGGAPGPFGSSGNLLQGDVGNIAAYSNGTAPLPTPVAVKTGWFTGNYLTTTEPYRYMRVIVSNVVVMKITPSAGAKPFLNSATLIINDGTGNMSIAAPPTKYSTAGQADPYSYLNAVTPGGLQVGDTVSFLIGVITSGTTLTMYSPQPTLPFVGTDSSVRACGLINGSEVGTVTRNGVALTTNVANCTTANGCFLYGVAQQTIVPAPPPPTTIDAVPGAIMQTLTTQPTGSTCSADACFNSCVSKLTFGSLATGSGGDLVLNFAPAVSTVSGCTCPTNCVNGGIGVAFGEGQSVSVAHGLSGGIGFTCYGGAAGASATVTTFPNPPLPIPGSNYITVAWSGLNSSVVSAAATTCSYAVTSGSSFDVNAFTSIPLSGSTAALTTVTSTITLTGFTQSLFSSAASLALRTTLGTTLGVNAYAISITATFPIYAVQTQSAMAVIAVVVVPSSAATAAVTTISGLGASFTTALNANLPSPFSVTGVSASAPVSLAGAAALAGFNASAYASAPPPPFSPPPPPFPSPMPPFPPGAVVTTAVITPPALVLAGYTATTFTTNVANALILAIATVANVNVANVTIVSPTPFAGRRLLDITVVYTITVPVAAQAATTALVSGPTGATALSTAAISSFTNSGLQPPVLTIAVTTVSSSSTTTNNVPLGVGLGVGLGGGLILILSGLYFFVLKKRNVESGQKSVIQMSAHVAAPSNV